MMLSGLPKDIQDIVYGFIDYKQKYPSVMKELCDFIDYKRNIYPSVMKELEKEFFEEKYFVLKKKLNKILINDEIRDYVSLNYGVKIKIFLIRHIRYDIDFRNDRWIRTNFQIVYYNESINHYFSKRLDIITPILKTDDVDFKWGDYGVCYSHIRRDVLEVFIDFEFE